LACLQSEQSPQLDHPRFSKQSAVRKHAVWIASPSSPHHGVHHCKSRPKNSILYAKGAEYCSFIETSQTTSSSTFCCSCTYLSFTQRSTNWFAWSMLKLSSRITWSIYASSCKALLTFNFILLD
jgi:hypothetical protein